MTFLQMKCFLSLAETRKISVTAAKLGLSLSTLSKYIDRMEDELSVPLFVKNRTQLTLTREGELIFPSIEYIVNQCDEQRAEMCKYTPERQMAVGLAVTLHQEKIMQRLVSFMETEPEIRLSITEASAHEVCSMLDSGEADIGIIYEQLVDKKYPISFPLNRDRLVAVVAEGHPLAGREAISVNELRGETFYFFKGDYLMYQYQLRVCISAGFVPYEKHSDFRLSTILKCVSAGSGVSLLAENTVSAQKINGISVLQLAESTVLTLCAVSASAHSSGQRDRLLSFLQTD